MSDSKESNLMKLLNIDLIISGITFLILVFITFMGVIYRYALSNPIIWLEEVQLVCMVIIVYFGISAAVRTGSHVAIDMIVEKFPEKTKRIIEIIIWCIIMIVLGYLFIQSKKIVVQMFQRNRATNILKIPYWLVYGSVPVGCILTMINFSIDYYNKVFNQEMKEVIDI
ncbi:TRAP transporter small permease [Fusobacterium sp. PH5-44]|uniref:TRAP transporter small permease n=1 Tax=unclassified Fusobacterium TaxID=2648384 RepID=UPI003D1FCAF5